MFPGRLYSAVFEAVAVTVQQDFFEILAATGKPITVHAIELEQTTEVGDAQEEMLAIRMVRGEGAVTSGTGGTTPTARSQLKGDTAFAGTVEANNTTKMVVGGGALVQLAAWAWNVRMPFNKLFTPEMRPIIVPGDRLTVELATTPGDSITINGTIWFVETGG